MPCRAGGNPRGDCPRTQDGALASRLIPKGPCPNSMCILGRRLHLGENAADHDLCYRIAPVVRRGIQVRCPVNARVDVNESLRSHRLWDRGAAAGRPRDEAAVLVVGLGTRIICRRAMSFGAFLGKTHPIESGEGIVGVHQHSRQRKHAEPAARLNND